MIKLDRILCPTDLSDFSKHSLRYGCEFANRFGAELHLLNIVQDVVALVPEPGMAFPAPGEYMQDLEKASRDALEQLPEADWLRDVAVFRDVRVGTPFLEIVRYAKEAEIDMIVLGTHGRSGLAHVLLGSTAEKVVRKAHCPVLTVRPEGHQFVMP
ncbi:MAG: universal stress protein [Planctomycetota bacterium]|nr:MAG: universal stress protein [Planctomycetota bacterium]REJ97526.1 MAG: universal stress protein [Planctomycetota bacterium]REK24346.1 MAG: universal stress protein [Planctomycetota bacterium]REK38537.1 MAG: universal stress protein [Planctomycetota bacterium]